MCLGSGGGGGEEEQRGEGYGAEGVGDALDGGGVSVWLLIGDGLDGWGQMVAD